MKFTWSPALIWPSYQGLSLAGLSLFMFRSSLGFQHSCMLRTLPKPLKWIFKNKLEHGVFCRIYTGESLPTGSPMVLHQHGEQAMPSLGFLQPARHSDPPTCSVLGAARGRPLHRSARVCRPQNLLFLFEMLLLLLPLDMPGNAEPDLESLRGLHMRNLIFMCNPVSLCPWLSSLSRWVIVGM